ncbi:hypothetical protein DSM19430T_26690 [Desulfovibrio psychrotolerans]|uniref:DUF2730 family protein n=2 Tax=Desulfovibrio psychrotolerans TaxID=415242 RepID=A0A7J0BXR7_9BACT|nr:hypothetical protein DSM19430T_26690 [Desulfovibrio psychrotolerans]
MLDKLNAYADLTWYALCGIVAAANAVLGWMLWSLRQTFVTRTELNTRICTVEEKQQSAAGALGSAVAELNVRVDRLEDALKALPTAADMREVLLAMEAIRGDIKEQSARMEGLVDEQSARLGGLGDVLNGVSRQVEMLFSHHIKEK